ncbi:crotonobetaine/carnitine-CoA ligase [Lentibacillus persicus]|uniref:Crotonobetaine/carnitine-CoA ligase n=1 Tax=Lentibacillus persicus TaxID=640948 RepID=A0A1I1S9B0_9BACI|nr:crotonobetaine/carnitine-CoA ligase [Lentibacillus persicus]
MYNGLNTFGTIVEHRAKLKSDERFIRFENTHLTYREFNEGGNQVANFSQQLGLEKSDTCAVMLPNGPEFMVTWLGLAKLGVIEVPINTAYKGDLLSYILNKSECKAIVISAQWVDRLMDIEKDLHYLQQIIVVGEKDQTTSNKFHWHSFENLLENASNKPVDVQIQPSTPAVILFTSGTTGPSKGVVLPHSANFSVAKTACNLMNYVEEDRLYTVFPLFHVNA